MSLSDYKMALLLQQQFEHEANVNSDNNSLIYKTKNGHKNDTKSLIDPSWELVDPTPNIFTLFVAFNDRYFWNKLVTVCVNWSKRMTTCAGICSYQGRHGMCKITLSEPLLKLRPRKDLVETLLHEMIHAYLFVTHNNKDRDGHGPEFHKHMFRINAEAGTNITVYHDFHDEVRLYQQHWWRCNGPCQNRKPYFGMVRRAMNRAPGPYDRWWAEHVRTCGGTYIKVKSPDKPNKGTKEENKPVNPDNDIRNYLGNNNSTVKGSGGVGNIGNNNKNSSNKTDLSNHQVISGNIMGFNDLRNKKTPNAVANSSSTVVINKKPSTKIHPTATITKPVSAAIFAGSGHSLKQITNVTPSTRNDYAKVRDHWLNKFNNTQNDNKRSSLESPSSPSKKPKVDLEKATESLVCCPVCSAQFPPHIVNSHLDSCLNLKDFADEINTDFVCDKPVPTISEQGTKVCDKCHQEVDKKIFWKHLDTCRSNINDINKIRDNALSECPVCDVFISAAELNDHVEICLSNMCTDIESKHDLGTAEREVSCLVCNKKILKSELTAHLDDCMNGVFSSQNDFEKNVNSKEDCKGAASSESIELKQKSDNIKYNCPFCLQPFLEIEMNAHLDLCLISDNDVQNEFDTKF